MTLSLPIHIFEDLPQAFLVGGSVRDLIQGAEPLDYDIAVPSLPGKFAQIMANRLNGKVVVLGKDRFTVYRVVSTTLSLDITPLKHNDIVTDLKTRDFTVNALAFDLQKKEIIDCVGGLKDLQNHRITMTYRNAFQDDPLRLVRAFRMAASMGFDIEPRTFGAIAKEAGAIRNSANERIWTELQLILACPDSYAIMEDMAKTELLFFIIPELKALRACSQNRFQIDDVFTHTLEAYSALENHLRLPDDAFAQDVAHFIRSMPLKRQILLKMAILLHDIGKPKSRQMDERGGIHFYGHAGISVQLSQGVCKRLRMSNRQQGWVDMIVRYHQRPLALFLSQHDLSSLRPKTIGRFFRQCGHHTPYVLIHAIADNLGKKGMPNARLEAMIEFFKNLLSTYIENDSTSIAPPLINGNDLIIQFNLKPSPLVGKLLRNVRELQMAGSLENREQALGWVVDQLKTC